jgi:hypothetical protein
LLGGQQGSYYTNASNINAGTIDDARLPDLITSNINIASGVSSVATLDVTNATIDNLTFTSGTAITSVDTDLNAVSGSDDTLASAKAIKTYVDAQVTAQDLDIQGDTGGALSIDLDSETLTIAGTANEIETVGSGNTITIGLPNDVTIGNDLIVTGDVGIGTDNPTQKLDVNGNARLRGALYDTNNVQGSSNQVLISTGSGGVEWSNVTTTGAIDGVLVRNDSTNQVQYLNFSTAIGVTTEFNVDISDLVYNPSTVRLGIGTTNPQSKLDIAGDVKISSTVSIGTTIDIVPYDNLGTLSFEGSAGQLFSITNNLTSGSIFSVNDVSGIPSIDVDANGTVLIAPYGSTEYVGIGTTNPTSKLSVVGDGNFTGVVTASSFSGNASSATYATNAGIATYATNAGIATYATNAGVSTYATLSGIATYATNAGIATYATNAGIATYATNAGIATYATNAGIALMQPQVVLLLMLLMPV